MAWLDNCKFTPAAGGLTDWVFSAAIAGYATPAQAVAVNAANYAQFAISPDSSQWEIAKGAYNSATGTFARTTVLYNSSGTGLNQGGSGSNKINFASVPSVAIVATAEDLTNLSGVTQPQHDNSTNMATTAYVDRVLARSWLAGLTLSTAGSSATFGVAVGSAMDSTNTAMMTLASAFTKTTGAWAAGSGNGALDTGTIAASSWYWVFEIMNPTTGAVDILLTKAVAATTPASSNLPSGFTLYRYIGSMKTDASSNWIAFKQIGDDFLWAAVAADLSTVTITVTTANLQALSVPPGVQVNALFRMFFNAGTGNFAVLVTSPDENDVAAASGANNADLFVSNGSAGGMVYSKRTDTSQRIRWRVSAVSGSPNASIDTFGWIDRRGRDS